MSYRAYTDLEFIEAVRTSKSIAEVLRKINMKAAGGNYHTAHKKILQLELDTTHFTGQLWSKDVKLKDYPDYKKIESCKKHLITERGRKCECCTLAIWNNKDIPIEVHHIDGNRFNNNSTNLQLLCPNCHAQTDNYRKPKGGMV